MYYAVGRSRFKRTSASGGNQTHDAFREASLRWSCIQQAWNYVVQNPQTLQASILLLEGERSPN